MDQQVQRSWGIPMPVHRRGCKETEAAGPEPKKGMELVGGFGDGMIPSGPSVVDIAEMEEGIC